MSVESANLVDSQAEQDVLAAYIREPEWRDELIDVAGKSPFSGSADAALWDQLWLMQIENDAPEAHPELPTAPSAAFAAGAKDRAATLAAAEHLRDLAQRRQLVELADRIRAAALAQPIDEVRALLDQAVDVADMPLPKRRSLGALVKQLGARLESLIPDSHGASKATAAAGSESPVVWGRGMVSVWTTTEGDVWRALIDRLDAEWTARGSVLLVRQDDGADEMLQHLLFARAGLDEAAALAAGLDEAGRARLTQASHRLFRADATLCSPCDLGDLGALVRQLRRRGSRTGLLVVDERTLAVGSPELQRLVTDYRVFARDLHVRTIVLAG